jgi:four helix bundle protein
MSTPFSVGWAGWGGSGRLEGGSAGQAGQGRGVQSDLCVAVHRLVRELPEDERFALGAQLRRAAYSVAANIVEGYAYPGAQMRLKHLRIAIGSLAEVGYAVRLSGRLGYVPDDKLTALDKLIRQTAAPLHGLVRHLKGEVEDRAQREEKVRPSGERGSQR